MKVELEQRKFPIILFHATEGKVCHKQTAKGKRCKSKKYIVLMTRLNLSKCRTNRDFQFNFKKSPVSFGGYVGSLIPPVKRLVIPIYQYSLFLSRLYLNNRECKFGLGLLNCLFLRAAWVNTAEAYPGFCGMTRLGVFILPCGKMLANSKVAPNMSLVLILTG